MDNRPLMEQPQAVRKPNLQASFAQTLPVSIPHHGIYESMMTAIGDCFGFFGSIPICCCTNPYRTVTQGSIGLIAKFGKCYKLVDPGLHQINLMTETLRTVDVKIQVEDIKKQVVLTKDNVAIYIDSVVYWQIIEPYTATYLVSNVRTALIERTQTTLRQIIGGRLLQDVIENRETISHEISEIIAEPARTWGIRIEAILIKDIQFSQDLLDNLAAAAKQKRVGESKVIAAEAEVSAAKLMREASDILNTPAAMQIRYLDVLATMAKTHDCKVVFLPVDGESATAGTIQKVVNSRVMEKLD